MNPEIKARIASWVASEAAEAYWCSLQPAADLLLSDVVDSSEFDTMRVLESPADPADLDATARLPVLDVGALPVAVRANLGATAEDDAQAVA